VMPTSVGSGVSKALILFVVVVVMVVLLSQCSGDRCGEIKNTFGASSAEYQQCARASSSGGRIGSSGGSYGGWSSGTGGHK
jgi:hypothetical protein